MSRSVVDLPVPDPPAHGNTGMASDVVAGAATVCSANVTSRKRNTL